MSLSCIQLKKNEERRIRAGHPWIYSNEIDTRITPLRHFFSGQEVVVKAHNENVLGLAYINPHSLITARMISPDPHTVFDQSFFLEKFQCAYELRQRLFPQPFYRLVFSEGDFLPGLIIDRFENDFVMQTNTAGMERKIDMIAGALKELFPDIHSILLRNDSQVRIQEGLEMYVKNVWGKTPDVVSLIENNVPFKTSLIQGQKTGWFYDHRLNRARLKDYVSQKQVLDVFSYVGGWGIQAAFFGASRADCIESSPFAAQFIEENARLNLVHEKVNVINEDAFEAMKNLLQTHKQYDVIILDPPAFVKKSKDKKEGLIAYQRLNEMAVKLLTPGGVLFTCSCSMHVSMQDLVDMLQRIAHRTQTRLQILERGHQGPDHPIHICVPETDYLKALMVRKI